MTHEYKIGETVIVTQRGCRSRKKIGKVQEITKAGNIRVDGILYNKLGTQRGSDSFWGSWIKPATAEEIEEIRHEGLFKDAETK